MFIGTRSCEGRTPAWCNVYRNASCAGRTAPGCNVYRNAVVRRPHPTGVQCL